MFYGGAKVEVFDVHGDLYCTLSRYYRVEEDIGCGDIRCGSADIPWKVDTFVTEQ